MVTGKAPRATVASLSLEAKLAHVDAVNCAGTCEAPIRVALTGTEDKVHYPTGVIAEGNTHHRAKIDVRCRRCKACRDYKRNFWAARALTEQAYSAETVFLTLTLGPEARMALLAFQLTWPRQPDTKLTEAMEAWLAHRWVAAEVQKLWKRLRSAGHKFRYFAAVEHHKDGTPHVHAMVFFQEPSLDWGKDARGFPKANATFSEAWGHGFTNTWRVDRTDNRRAFYVAKYVAKGNTGRLAASQQLGRLLLTSSERSEIRGGIATP